MAFDPRVPAWTFDEASGQYYLNQFLPSQPDLNWWNDEVRDAFDDILRFWFDRGVAGFRIDVCHSIIKDRELRDNPPATEGRPLVRADDGAAAASTTRAGPRCTTCCAAGASSPTSYDPPRVLIGETYVLDPEAFASFYGNGDELNLAFNFMLLHAELRRRRSCATRSSTPSGSCPRNAWPVWTGGNHDNHRFPTRWGGNDPRKARAAMVMLMGLRGTPFLYYGDEIGMIDTDVPTDRILDPVGSVPRRAHRAATTNERRCTGRREPGAGFSEPGVEPWLPVRRLRRDQRRRPAPRSRLDAVADPRPDRTARRDARAAPRRVRTTRRADATMCGPGSAASAPSSRATSPTTRRSVPDVGPGAIRISTIRSRDDERVDNELALAPWEAAIVWRD